MKSKRSNDETHLHTDPEDLPLSVGMRCVSSTSLPVASTVLPFSSRMRGVGLFTSLISTLLQFHKQIQMIICIQKANTQSIVFPPNKLDIFKLLTVEQFPWHVD